LKPFYLQEQLSDLKGTNVIDMSGFKIGKVFDFVIDGNYSLTKVILRHSLLEEIAKKLHLKPKVHYVIPIDALKNGMSGDYLEAITSLDELLKESDDDAINQDERKFSKILRKKITDKNGEHVGRIIDAIVHIDCKLSFILGGSLFEEIREDLGMIPDLDIFLPCNLIIREDGNTFHIKSDKSALSKKATREDIIRGINFDRYPGERRHVFYRYEVDFDVLVTQKEQLEVKLKASNLARGLVVKNLNHSTQLEDFSNLHNEIFLASPDPVRELSLEETKQFSEIDTFVASVAGLMAGFVYLPTEKKDEMTIGAIAGIGVLARYRGKKVGYALLLRAIEYFGHHNVQKVVCEIYEKNEPSRSFFESLGFEIYGHMVLEDEH
jgi:ribosomal protein S18 acetylase RimI-like enzyme/sporulation protein YlmC with PRC-barrel domain